MKTFSSKLAFSLIFTLFVAVGWGQTNPTPHNLGSSNFSFTGFGVGTTTTYPTSMQGHGFSSERTSANKTDVASSNIALSANSTAFTTSSIRNEVASGISLLSSGSANFGTIVVALDATNRQDITLGWTCAEMSPNGTNGNGDRQNAIELQYRVGTSGSWTAVSGTTYQSNVSSTTFASPQTFSSIVLPTACNNEAIVQVRWLYYYVTGSGSRDRIRLDDITISSTAASSGCSAPTTQASAITFSNVTTNAMDVNWTNGNGDGRVVIMNTSNTFTAPANGSNPTANTVYSGSGQQVVYNGTGNSVSITGLTPGTTYWYRIYEFCNPDRTYQTATATGNPNSQQTVPPPTITRSPATLSGFTYVSGNGPSSNQTFTVSGVGLTSNLVITAPANYQISLSATSGFGSSINLTPTGGTVPTTTIYVRLAAGLSVGNYNSENIVCSSTGATSLNVTCSGSVTASNASDIIAVSGSESITISSIMNDASPLTSTTGVQVWQIRVRDGGASLNDADDLPTILTAFTLAQAAGNQVNDWGANIQSAALFDGSTFIASANVTSNQIQFTGLNVIVADNTEKTLSLRLSLNCPLTASHGEDFRFSLSNANTTFSSSGSAKTSFSAQTSTNDLNAINVVPTALSFIQQPTNIGVFGTMTPSVTVAAVDACGNIATSFTGSVSITSTGTLSSTPITVNAINGVATFSNIVHTAIASGRTLNATSGGLNSVTSNSFDVLDVTILEPGDLVIVAINTNIDSGDEICFFAFKDILPGTSIEITDNGYERVSAGLWGNTEGTIRFTYNGINTISAGTTICFKGSGSNSSNYDVIVCGTNNTTDWSITSLNGGNSFDLNSTDQLWILQNGTWNPGTANAHNATYTGNFVWGWTATGWESAPGYASTSGSTLPEGTACLNSDLNGVSNPDKVKYTGPMSTATQSTWISRINNPANWTGYSNNTNYNSGGQNYAGSCVTFPITSGGYTAGLWTGASGTDWFNCANWENLQVPDSTINVVVPNTTNKPVITTNTAYCKNITINFNSNLTLNGGTSMIKIYGDLINNSGNNLTLTNTFAITGGVKFSGGVTQTISGFETYFGYVAAEKGTNLVLNANIRILNSFDVIGNNTKLGASHTPGNQRTLTLTNSANFYVLGTDGASMDNSALDFLNISAINGTGPQTIDIRGYGTPIKCWNFLATKNSGLIYLLLNQTPLICKNDFNTNLTGTAYFQDSGNEITVGNNIVLNGAGNSNYQFSGTFVLNGAGSGTNSNILNGANAIVGQLNNLTINTPVSKPDVNIYPLTGTQATTIKGNLTLQTGVLKVHNNTINIGGNYDNQVSQAALEEGNSTFSFIGAGTNQISCNGTEIFYNLALNKTGNTKANINQNVEVANQLSLNSGILTTGSNSLRVSNSATTAVTGGKTSGDNKYIEGTLLWATDNNLYTFPIGYDGFGAQGFDILVTGTGNIQGFLEPYSYEPDLPFAYCDLGISTGQGQDVGQGLQGTDGILDRVRFEINTPLQWDVTNPMGGVSSYDITLYANSLNDISPVVANGDEVRYTMRNGKPGNDNVATGLGLPSFTDQGFIVCPTGNTLSGLTSFSSFNIVGATQSNVLLPVEMLYFYAKSAENSYIKLHWATATEINNEGFEVQKSINGVDFTTIGYVAGAGDHTGKLDYNFNDYEVKSGVDYYYRLKQNDFDGEFDFSKIVMARLNGNNHQLAEVYPVPSNGKVFIKSSEEILNTSIFDMTGKKLVTSNLTNEIDISNLPQGVYLLQIKTAINSQTVKIIRE